MWWDINTCWQPRTGRDQDSIANEVIEETGQNPLDNDSLLADFDLEKQFKLTFFQKVVVGSGHILNDLCASLWFSYFLLYFENVVGLSPDHAAVLMLIGQVVDGVATPLVGYQADRNESCRFCFRSYGRCKAWHFYGTVFVGLSFPFIFNWCPGPCHEAADWVKLLYYIPFVTVFQIGWAANQISHLALIAKVNPDELVRTELLAMRYGFTVFSNIFVFVMAWQLLGFGGQVDASDAQSFLIIALIAVTIGLICSAFFHFRVREHRDLDVKRYGALLVRRARGGVNRRVSAMSSSVVNRNNREFVASQTHIKTSLNLWCKISRFKDVGDKSGDGDLAVEVRRRKQKACNLSTKSLSLGRERMRTRDWLMLPQFYIVALIYMATRLCVNLTQVYMPLYLQRSVQLEKFTVATVPLTMYIFGFLIAICIKLINKHVGRQFAYVIGAAFSVCGAFWILLDDVGSGTGLSIYKIYVVAALLGSGASALLVTSLAITADLIGNNVENGAFVYGAMSFTDKLSCGLAVMGINAVVPCQPAVPESCNGDTGRELGDFYKYVMVAVSGGAAVIGIGGIIVVTVFLYVRRFKAVSRSSQTDLY